MKATVTARDEDYGAVQWTVLQLPTYLIKGEPITNFRDRARYAMNLEYLYDEMVKLRKKKGVTLEAHHIRENPEPIHT